MCVNVHTKFGVYSVILTSFRQGVISPPRTPPQNEPLKGQPRLGLQALVNTRY